MKESQFEMILCVVNAGYSSLVMDAARAEGAGGGTVIHARGTANKEAEEFFHISIQPEKDVVMLIVPKSIKDNVLHAIYKSAGTDTPGQGIAFSLPVDKAVGLRAGKAMGSETTKAPEKEEKND